MAKFVLRDPIEGFAAQEMEIEGLAILTGVNGAGKSRFLKKVADQMPDHASRYAYDMPPKIQLARDFAKIELRNQFTEKTSEWRSAAPARLERRGGQPHDASSWTFFKDLSEKSGKPVDEITEADILLGLSLSQMDLPEHNLPLNISLFQFKEAVNRLQRRTDYEDETNLALTEEQFFRAAGVAPWIRMNEAMRAANFPYEIRATRARLDQSLTSGSFDYLHSDGHAISHEGLSGGEQIILNLIAQSVFGAERHHILLLDEVDAVLHPSAVQSLITGLQRSFVQRGIPVLMVSHSPTTVALAPEDSLYVLKPSASGRVLCKTTREDALQELCVGIPMLRVGLIDRRVVFTESEYDRAFYEAIFLQQAKDLNSDYQLVFVESGRGGKNANSEAVVKLVDSMVENGAEHVFGVIDYDSKNKSSDHVKVLAEGKAYTLENVLLDPLLMAIYLRKAGKISADAIGIDPMDGIDSFAQFSQQKLQRVADSLLAMYAHRVLNSDQERVQWRYKNGRYIDLPVSFLTLPGHDLVSHVEIKNEFQAMFAGNKASPLQTRMPEVFREYRGWTPEVLVELMQVLAPARLAGAGIG
jgi:ABC-type Mn2+/Zn2+ transport system ATPase subunit